MHLEGSYGHGSLIPLVTMVWVADDDAAASGGWMVYNHGP